MHSDNILSEALDIVCQHYRRYYEQAELRRYPIYGVERKMMLAGCTEK